MRRSFKFISLKLTPGKKRGSARVYDPSCPYKIKVANTQTNTTFRFLALEMAIWRAHTARMNILIICVSVFLTGYAARMVRLSVKNRYRYSKHVNHRVFPAGLPHYTPNTGDYATWLSQITQRGKFGLGASEVGLAGWLSKFVFSKIISISRKAVYIYTNW